MRKALIVVGIVVAVIVAGLVVVYLNLEGIVNRNKDFLLSKAEESIGRKVTIGNIGVTLSGGIGVRLEDFAVADDPGFSDEPFVQAKSLQVNAKLMPLLQKKFEIKRVILHDPRIQIIKNEDGVLSTATFGPATATSTTSDAGSPAPGAAEASPLAISLVDIKNGELRFVDRSQDLDITVTRIESRVEELDLEEPISLSMKAAFLSDDQNINLSGTFGPLLPQSDPMTMSIESSLDVTALDFGLMTEALPAIAAAVPPGVEITGPVALTAHVQGTMADMAVQLDIDATSMVLKTEKGLSKPQGMTLSLGTSSRVSPEGVAIDKIDIAFHKLKATGSGQYLLGTPPSVDLKFRTDTITIADWIDMVPELKTYSASGSLNLSGRIHGKLEPGTVPNVDGKLTLTNAGGRPPQLLKPVTNAGAEVVFGDQKATVSDMSFTVGASTVTGSAQLVSFDPPIIEYSAQSASLALDDVRPPNPKVKKPEILKNLVLKGRMVADETPMNRGELSSASGTVGDIDYTDLKAQFDIVGKKTVVEKFSVRALDGTIDGSGVVVMNDDGPAFDFKTNAREVNVFTLLEKLPDASHQFLRGSANMTLNVSGQGSEWQEIQKTISGGGIAEVFDGAIIDFNLFEGVTNQLSSIAGRQDLISQNLKDKYPKVFLDRSTSFNDLKSDFVIEDGKLLARNVSLRASEFDIGARGAIGFDKSIILSANLRLSRELTADLIKDFKEAKYLTNEQGQIEIPFALEGMLPKPKAKLEKDFVNRIIEKALVQKGFDLFEKQGLGDGLKDLFGGKKKAAPPDTTK